MPSGERMPVYYSETQSKRQIVEDVLLRPWTQYCLRHWMSADGKPGSAEQRIKRFLDGCAYLLLRDNPEGTLTDYKEMTRGRNEIDVSSCPAWVGDLLDAGGYSLRGGDIEENARFFCLLERLEERAEKYKKQAPEKARKKEQTRFQRLQKIRNTLPGCNISSALVDTENVFSYGGRQYQISPAASQYAPRQTREGELYDMDRVLIVERDGVPVMFLDQLANKLEEGCVCIRDRTGGENEYG